MSTISTDFRVEAFHLELLVAAGRRLGCRHASLFGAALRKPLREVADVDVHMVLPRIDRMSFNSLVAAAEATAKALAEQLGRPWCVELRHGPFKPPPEEIRPLQLHLLLDDEATLSRMPCAILTQRAATGLLLAGEPLGGARLDCEAPATWKREAREELARWRNALAAGEIVLRTWVFDPEPCLADRRLPARTAWEHACLLQGAARATDLHFRSARLLLSGLDSAHDELSRPLLSQLGDEIAWEALPDCWERVSRQAAAVIERRLDCLSCD